MTHSKIGFVSLGCPKNLVDGEVMLGLARDAGHEITADARDADVIVVNTCAFIDNAKEESVDAILEMAQLKRDGACKRLIVTGCLAERYRDQLKAEIPEIDVCLGTGEVPEIVGAIGGDETAGVPLKLDGTLTRGLSRLAKAGTGPFTPASESGRPGRDESGTLARARERQGASPGLRQTGQAPRRESPTYLYVASTPRLLTTPRHFAYV